MPDLPRRQVIKHDAATASGTLLPGWTAVANPTNDFNSNVCEPVRRLSLVDCNWSGGRVVSMWAA